jgi:hypothetical protein
MQSLQVRWGRVDDQRIVPARPKFDAADRQRDPLHRYNRQIEMKVNPVLMLESDLLAVTARAVVPGGFLLAMPVRIAATVRLPEREVLFARYAASPDQRHNQEQGK